MNNKVSPYPIPTICTYCGAKVIFTSNASIYGKEYGNGKCYKCTNCDSYVGVHDGTKIPLGLLANKELRELKKQCHALFDPVWKEHKYLKRHNAYKRLANKLGISVNECHFGWFDKEMLNKCLGILGNSDWYIKAGVAHKTHWVVFMKNGVSEGAEM